MHLTELPEASGQRDEELAARWEDLFKVREEVMRALEEARVAKLIGGSLEAAVDITASGKTYDLLAGYGDNLRFLFIVSQVSLIESRHRRLKHQSAPRRRTEVRALLELFNACGRVSEVSDGVRTLCRSVGRTASQ